MKKEFTIDQIREFVKKDYPSVSARMTKCLLQYYEEYTQQQLAPSWVKINDKKTNLPGDNECCLWMKFPVNEPPYCGFLLDVDFPKPFYFTHYMVLNNDFFRLDEQPAERAAQTDVATDDWISVEDRLPEKKDNWDFSEDLLTYEAESGTMDIEAYWPKLNAWDLDRKVTHWMPLPNPPKE